MIGVYLTYYGFSVLFVWILGAVLLGMTEDQEDKHDSIFDSAALLGMSCIWPVIIPIMTVAFLIDSLKLRVQKRKESRINLQP